MSEKKYSTSISPSTVWLPKGADYRTIYEFIIEKFPRIDSSIWLERFAEGKVFDSEGKSFTCKSPYQGDQHISYFREVPCEEKVPFEEEVIFQNENFLVVDKPHFLPVHPSGQYVNETLVNRLKVKTGNKSLVTAHRLDRLTAGLVLCILDSEKRGAYQSLFSERKVRKTYLAIGKKTQCENQSWHIKNCIEKVNPRFLMRVGDGEVNSESFIKILREHDGRALFELKPVTGKKHQLRVHMAHIGSGIENDPLYPVVQEDRSNDFEKPMQLLAKKLEFEDPFSGESMVFESKRTLEL